MEGRTATDRITTIRTIPSKVLIFKISFKVVLVLFTIFIFVYTKQKINKQIKIRKGVDKVKPKRHQFNWIEIKVITQTKGKNRLKIVISKKWIWVMKLKSNLSTLPNLDRVIARNRKMVILHVY